MEHDAELSGEKDGENVGGLVLSDEPQPGRRDHRGCARVPRRRYGGLDLVRWRRVTWGGASWPVAGRRARRSALASGIVTRRAETAGAGRAGPAGECFSPGYIGFQHPRQVLSGKRPKTGFQRLSNVNRIPAVPDAQICPEALCRQTATMRCEGDDNAMIAGIHLMVSDEMTVSLLDCVALH